MNVEYTVLAIIPILIVIGLILMYLRNREEINIKAVTGGIVCIAILVLAGIPIMSASVTDTEDDIPSTIAYDDYYETKATSADGALELIEADGRTYAHAKDIGTATLHYGNGSRTITVTKAQLDVFLLDGQSNMAYNSTMADVGTASPVPKVGQAYYFGSSEVAYNAGVTLTVCRMYSVANLDGSAQIGRFECPFEAKWTELTGHKVLTVNAAIGGKSIDLFQPTAGEMYVRTVDAWNTALSIIPTEYYNVTVMGMIWCQGEADRDQTVDWYKTRFTTMLDAFESTAFDTPIAKCYIDLITSLRGVNARTAQIEIASERSDVEIATTLSNTFSIEAGTMFDDNTHYTQKGQNILGVAVAEYIYTHQ